MQTDIIATLIVFVLWILLLMYKQAQENRGANLLEESLMSQGEDQMLGVRPARREEIENLNRELSKRLTRLKLKTCKRKRRPGCALCIALVYDDRPAGCR